MAKPPGPIPTDSQRLVKFCECLSFAFQGPLYAASRPWGVTVTFRTERPFLDVPGVDQTELLAAITRTRGFFLPSEDVYLPSVSAALRRSLRTRDLDDALDHLDQTNAQLFGERGHLRGGEGDIALVVNGERRSVLELGMEYIYGVALHLDEPRRDLLRDLPLTAKETEGFAAITIGRVMMQTELIGILLARARLAGELPQLADHDDELSRLLAMGPATPEERSWSGGHNS